MSSTVIAADFAAIYADMAAVFDADVEVAFGGVTVAGLRTSVRKDEQVLGAGNQGPHVEVLLAAHLSVAVHGAGRAAVARQLPRDELARSFTDALHVWYGRVVDVGDEFL